MKAAAAKATRPKADSKKPAPAAKKGLLDDEDEDNVGEFRVNENFAKRFQHNKEREELHRLQAKHPHLAAKMALKAERKAAGLPSESEGDSDDDDSESSDEDDDPEEAVDEHFLKTLLSIRKRDPAIYEKDAKLFPDAEEIAGSDEDEEEKPKPKQKKETKKKLTLRARAEEVQARQLLEDGPAAAGESSDSDEDGLRKKAGGLTYREEQAAIKRELLNALNADGEDGDEDAGDALLRKKHKTPAELRAERKEADEQAIRTAKLLEEVFQKKAKKGAKGAKGAAGAAGEQVEEEEDFLKEYIGNRMWLGDGDEEDDGRGGIVFGAPHARAADAEDVSDDEAEVEKQEAFETRYNFRFEEPGGAALRSHSRTQEASIRKGSDARKDKRKEVADRKTAEKLKLQEEIKRLKNLKKKEIDDKLQQIRSVAGDAALALGADELDADFDAAAYDARMGAAFGDESGYYDKEEEDEAGVKKPEFGDMEEELQELLRGEAKHPPKSNPGAAGDDDEDEDEEEASGSDASEDEAGDGAEVAAGGADAEGNKFSKKAMKKWRQALQKKMDEYLKLDAEDFVAGMPTRFRYKPVPPNLYGLKLEEILLLEDKELNQVVSIKKMAPYQDDEDRPQYGHKRERALAALRRVYKDKLGRESSRKRGRGDAEGNDEAAARAASFVAPTKKARRAALEAAKQPAGLTRPDGKKLSKSAAKRIRRRAAARDGGGGNNDDGGGDE